jgi:hypothetical protein
MRSFAALGLRQRLDRCGPLPSRLKNGATDRRATNVHNFHFSLGKRADFIRLPKTLDTVRSSPTIVGIGASQDASLADGRRKGVSIPSISTKAGLDLVERSDWGQHPDWN